MFSYWNNNGFYQEKIDILHDLIDEMMGKNTVKNSVKNKQLERLRKTINAYYRLFNDGDSNGSLLGVYSYDMPNYKHHNEEVYKIIMDRNCQTANDALDRQIQLAWKEQEEYGNV